MPNNIIKDLRIKCRVSRKYLAEMLGLTESGYYYKESGKYPFTIGEYRELFKIYKSFDPDLTADEFFMGVKENTEE